MKKYGCKCWIADSNFHTFHVYVSVTYIPIIYIFMFENRPIRKNSIQACTRMHDCANRILKQGLYLPDTGGKLGGGNWRAFPKTSRCGDAVVYSISYSHISSSFSGWSMRQSAPDHHKWPKCAKFGQKSFDALRKNYNSLHRSTVFSIFQRLSSRLDSSWQQWALASLGWSLNGRDPKISETQVQYKYFDSADVNTGW